MESLLRALLGNEAALQQVLAIGGLVAARVAPLTVFAPWLSLKTTPPVLRAALVLALTAAFTPLALGSAGGAVDLGGAAYAAAVLREAMVGTLFAVATALPFYSLDWAGRLTDTWRGASMSEVIAPNTGERTSPLGDLHMMLGIALFLVLGGHRLAFAAFAEGLSVAPVGTIELAPRAADLAWGAARLTGAALAFALAIAAPAAASIVVVEVALGLLARSAPQVPVFFAGMPLRAATGVAAALLALSLVTAQLPDVFRAAIEIARDWVTGR